MLVGADLQRPAAVDQLRTLGRQVDVIVYSDDEAARSGTGDPVSVARRGLDEARRLGKDVLIVDTAGRLAIDAEMMDQVRRISEAVEPNYTFLVVDAMTGQDAVTVAEAFHETLELDGVILSKLDGDARGGAALSVKEVIGRPIAFASTGEKMDAFDQFHPDRMAGRILGMGDVLSLIEQAEEVFERTRPRSGPAARRAVHLRRLPGPDAPGAEDGVFVQLGGYDARGPERAQERQHRRRRAQAGRSDHLLDDRRRATPAGLINGSRRLRIANGSGTTTGEVNRLVKQFQEMQKLMKRMGGLGSKKGKRRMPSLPPGFPGMN